MIVLQFYQALLFLSVFIKCIPFEGAQQSKQINIMLNEQIKEKIESIWVWLRSLTAADIVHQIAISQNEAESIIGKNEIEKVKTLPLLKLIVYQLIIFANQKCSCETSRKSIHKQSQTSFTGEKGVKSLNRVQEIKQLLANIAGHRKQISNQIVMDKYEFKSLARKLNSLEQHLSNEEIRSNKSVDAGELDLEGMELMITQLEKLVKKKESRIRELNAELEENFNDKQQLEDDIEELERRNGQLEERIRELEEECNDYHQGNQALKQQLKGQKFSPMSSRPPISKTLVHCSSNTQSIPTECDFPSLNKQESIRDSNIILARYTPAVDDDQNQKRTAKKIPQKLFSKDSQLSQQNLLQSLRYIKQQKSINNDDNCLDQLLLLQALVIEHAIQNATY